MSLTNSVQIINRRNVSECIWGARTTEMTIINEVIRKCDRLTRCVKCSWSEAKSTKCRYKNIPQNWPFGISLLARSIRGGYLNLHGWLVMTFRADLLLNQWKMHLTKFIHRVEVFERVWDGAQRNGESCRPYGDLHLNSDFESLAWLLVEWPLSPRTQRPLTSVLTSRGFAQGGGRKEKKTTVVSFFLKGISPYLFFINLIYLSLYFVKISNSYFLAGN